MLLASASTARSMFTPVETAGIPTARSQKVLTIYSSIRIYAGMKIDITRMAAAADDASGLLKAMAGNLERMVRRAAAIGRNSAGPSAEPIGSAGRLPRQWRR